MGFSNRNKKVINKLPKRTRIFIDCGIAESDLTKWKRGINHFTKSDFIKMWTSLNSESNDPKAAFLEPWPLFIAATIFQNVFTDGQFYYSVKITGVYCHLSCCARQGNRAMPVSKLL